MSDRSVIEEALDGALLAARREACGEGLGPGVALGPGDDVMAVLDSLNLLDLVTSLEQEFDSELVEHIRLGPRVTREEFVSAVLAALARSGGGGETGGSGGQLS